MANAPLRHNPRSKKEHFMGNDHSIPWSQIILKAFFGLVLACVLGLTGTLPALSQEIVAIAAGGPAESNSSGGDYSFVADEDFSGGGDNSPVTATINLTHPGANAAPMGVYQHGRAGAFTYTIPGLTGLLSPPPLKSSSATKE